MPTMMTLRRTLFVSVLLEGGLLLLLICSNSLLGLGNLLVRALLWYHAVSLTIATLLWFAVFGKESGPATLHGFFYGLYFAVVFIIQTIIVFIVLHYCIIAIKGLELKLRKKTA